MLLDLKETGNQNVQSDVCIIGAGAAGISMALEFEQLGIKTTLLEGGGLTYPKPGSHDLYEAHLGEKFYPLQASRLRYLGGSTNHWGGWSRQLDDFDFIDKPYFDVKGWPIQKKALNAYYKKAADICQIPNFLESHDGTFKHQLKQGVLSWSDGGFENKFFVFSPPTRFGKVYLDALKTATQVQCFLHANATQLLYDENGRVSGVNAQSLEGDVLTVRAKHVVLAMGGLENPRFMLNQQSESNPNGVGNQNDLVGRYFMDHPGFQPVDLLLPEKLNYRRHQFKDQPVMPVISMGQEALLKHQLNNFCILLNQKKDHEHMPAAYGNNAWFEQHEAYGTYQAQFIFEPSPCRDSRVTLTAQKDQLGMKQLKLDWQFNQRDFESVDKVVHLLTQELGTKNQGRVHWHKQFTSENIAKLNGGMHHGGTTMMANIAEDGVVDSDCQVFGTPGLYVAGNSVFPNIGFSNPTVTLIALALKLSHHIKGQLS